MMEADMNGRRIAAIFLLIAGFGWNAGLQAQPFGNLVAGIGILVGHLAPLALLVVFAMPLLLSPRTQRRRWQTAGISVLAAVALLFDAFVVVFSIMNPHASFGMHSVNDAIPDVILAVGALMWLTAFDSRRELTGPA
jgi:hypothetical protein